MEGQPGVVTRLFNGDVGWAVQLQQAMLAQGVSVERLVVALTRNKNFAVGVAAMVRATEPEGGDIEKLAA